MMKKVFFIDSENVGDNWIGLLPSVSSDDELLVFYTQNTPHMSYENVISLKETDKNVRFIECFCGNNGLDFQLSTELGSRTCLIGDDAFVIVSNDTGFDAVVKYWNKRNINVSRIKGNNCKSSNENGEAVDSASVNNIVTPVSKPIIQSSEVKAKASLVDDNAKEILYIVGRENLQILHEALQQLYGTKQGNSIYNAFKPNTAYTDFLSKHKKLNVNDKQKQYCSIVFSVSAPNEVMPEGFSEFIVSSWKKKKNLNSLKSLLQQKYGKTKSEKYYSLFKVHIKLLTQIK